MGDIGTWVGVGTSPRLLSAVVIRDRAVRATFNEAMKNNAALTTPANYVFTALAGGAAVAAVTVVPGTDLTYVDILTDVSFSNGTANYRLTVNNAIEDTAGNTLDPSYDEDVFDGVAPSLAPRVLYKGLLEAIVEAISETDAEIGGLRMTRLTAAMARGDTVALVESTLDWEDSGKIAIDGITYSYTSKSAGSFIGLSYQAAGATVAGAAGIHRDLSVVTDLNQIWSALDQLRRALLVDYAVGGNLDVIGRNLGVARRNLFSSDSLFREVIKVLAYNPRGTIFGIELILTALYGAGNFEIFEDLLQYPNTVFIRITDDVLDTPLLNGKAFLERKDYEIVTNTVVVLNEIPKAIESAKFLEVDQEFSFRDAKPSALTYAYYPGATPASAFTFVGADEATEVLLTPGTGIEMLSTGPEVSYKMTVAKGYRVQYNSNVEVKWIGGVMIPISAGLTGDVHLKDGTQDIHVRIDNTGVSPQIGLYRVGTGHLGTPVTLSDQYYEFKVVQNGMDPVELWIDGVLEQTVPYPDFAATSSVEFTFGVTGSGMSYVIKEVNINTDNYDFWKRPRLAIGTVSGAEPTKLNDSGAIFADADVGKQIVITKSLITNTQGGNNTGKFVIAVKDSSTKVTLAGKQRTGLEIVDDSSAGLVAILPHYYTLRYPEDLGKTLVITGSTLGNNGSYTISKLYRNYPPYVGLDEYDTPCSLDSYVLGTVASFTAEENNLNWRIDPAFIAELAVDDLDYEIANSGTIISATWIGLKTNFSGLPVNNALMEVTYMTDPSSQVREAAEETIVESAGPPPVYSQYPFFLTVPLADLQVLLDELTAAGVFPETEVIY